MKIRIEANEEWIRLGVYEKRTSWLEYTISLENIEYKVKENWSVKIYTIMYN